MIAVRAPVRRGPALRWWALAATLAHLGCTRAPTPALTPAAPGATDVPTTTVETGPRCPAVAQDGALLVLRGDRCPVVVRGSENGAELELVRADPDGSRHRWTMTAWPSPCADDRCRLDGVVVDGTPVLLAVKPGAESEVPRGVWAALPAGPTLWWVDLWAGAGEPAQGDHTDLGPSHALAVWRCGDRIVLHPEARLAVGRSESPAPTLLARSGELGADGSIIPPDPQTPAPSAADCTPIPIAARSW